MTDMQSQPHYPKIVGLVCHALILLFETSRQPPRMIYTHRDHRRIFFTGNGVSPLAPSIRLQTQGVALASTHGSDKSHMPRRLPTTYEHA